MFRTSSVCLMNATYRFGEEYFLSTCYIWTVLAYSESNVGCDLWFM